MEKAGNQLSRYGAIANPVEIPMTAKVFFVASSDAAGYETLGYEFPVDKDGETRVFQTLDAAVSAATADRGDVIYVMPGHAETLTGAGAITLDVAGVKIVGLGHGTKRPTFLLDGAATVDIAVSADNVTIENCVFSAGHADIANVFEVGAAKNFTIKNCEFKANTTDENFLAIVGTNTTDNAADGLTIDGCKWIEADTATTSMVDVDADIDGLTVKNCYANLGVNTNDLPIVAYVATGKDLTNVQIMDNKFVRLNDANPLLADPDTTTANTGVISGNFIRHADVAGELLVTAATDIGFHNNYASAVADKSGFILPAVDS